MVLTKDELIASLKNEIRLILHLAGKIDQSKSDYRPTTKQRSTLELLQYIVIMAPTQIVAIKSGDFSREAMMATWGPAEAASKTMTLEQAISAIEKQSADFDKIFSDWSDADFRGEVELFGQEILARLSAGESCSQRFRGLSHAAFLLSEVHWPRRAQHHEPVDGHRRFHGRSFLADQIRAAKKL